MKTLKRALFLLLAVVMVASCFAACGGGGLTAIAQQQIQGESGTWDGTPQYGGHLNARTTARPNGLDPLKQTGAWKYQWTSTVYEPFLSRDPEHNIQPCVCDYVMLEYHEENGQLYTKLWLWPREGYTFSHGYGQVEADDLEASFNRGLLQYANVKKFVSPNVLSSAVEELSAQPADIQEQIKAKDADVTEVFHVEFKYHERNLYYLASFRTWWPVMPKEICDKYASSSTYIINELEDAVGTGPYYFSDFKDSTYVAVTKREDYVPVEQDPSQKGMSGTKYGYLDSMTFWFNNTDASAANAVLSGQYDCTEVIPAEYASLAEQNGIVLTKLRSDQRTWIIFNTMGTDNVVAKYPSLRKAVMAAIDYPSYLKYITDDSQVLDGDNLLLNKKFDLTDKFKAADYYGEYDQAVVDKYMAMAREEGYNNEPLQIPHPTSRTDISTITASTMERAGINYDLVPGEATVYNDLIGDPANNWDFYFNWATTFQTPGTMSDSMVKNNFKSDRIQEIRETMVTSLHPSSEEYMALWEEWTDIWVEECQMGYLGAVDFWWWHPKTLHINDGGDDPNDMCAVSYTHLTLPTKSLV